MKAWIIFTTILVPVIGYVDEYNLIHFSKSKDELAKCLESTNFTEVLNETVKDVQLKSYLFERLSSLLHKQTVPVETIDTIAVDLVNVVKQRLHLLHLQSVSMNNTNVKLEGEMAVAKEISVEASGATTSHEDKAERIKAVIISASHQCSDPEDPNSEIGVSEIAPPRFVQEIPELAELLNMILVIRIWETFELSIYSERSLTLIETSLRTMNNAQDLFKELFNMWNRRVGLFFDGRENPEYFVSLYSNNRTVVCTDFMFQIPNRLFNNIIHNTSVLNEDLVFEMTRYRASSIPNSVSMTKSQYYFKYQLHQFFQMLFAYLESVERGLTENSEIYEWEAFKKKLPQLHFFSKNGYEAYLQKLQRRELSHKFVRNSPIFSSLVPSLKPGEQIDEFDLAMIYWHRLRSIGVNTTTTTKNWYKSFKHQLYKVFKPGPSKSKTTKVTTTTMTTTPSYTHLSSTSSYDESKRSKGPVIRLPSGKFVLKNQQGSGENNYYNNPSNGNERKYTQNSNDMAKNYDKFSVDSDDSDQSSIFLTTLENLMHMQEGISFY